MGDQKKREKLFLEELFKLERKHDVYVCGCGCCGSPYLDEEPSLSGEIGMARRDWSEEEEE